MCLLIPLFEEVIRIQVSISHYIFHGPTAETAMVTLSDCGSKEGKNVDIVIFFALYF